MAGDKRDTKRTGDISEAMVLAALVRCGYTVAIPFGENQRWDAVIERDNVLARVQIKTGRLRKGVIIYNACSSHAHRNGRTRNYFGQVEYFGVYCPELEQSFLVPIEHATATYCSLRVDVTKNGQAKRLRWAHHYVLTEDRDARGRVEADLWST
jgi:glucose dehydrogenase